MANVYLVWLRDPIDPDNAVDLAGVYSTPERASEVAHAVTKSSLPYVAFVEEMDVDTEPEIPESTDIDVLTDNDWPSGI